MKVVESYVLNSQTVVVHPTAIVDPGAILEPGVQIGPFALIGPDVHIGEGTVVEAFARVQGPTIIGRYNKIRSYSFVGCDTQDKKFKGGISQLIIGDHNDIREYATISRGSSEDTGLTRIGSHNLLMAYVHIAHDCLIGDHNTFSNNSSLAGHVVVGSYVGMGGFSGVHQFCKIGSYAFCGGGSIITKDVPPYTLVAGQPVRLIGLNLEGLKRRNFAEIDIQKLKVLYRSLFRQSLCLQDTVLEMLKNDSLTLHEKSLLEFVMSSERGVTR